MYAMATQDACFQGVSPFRITNAFRGGSPRTSTPTGLFVAVSFYSNRSINQNLKDKFGGLRGYVREPTNEISFVVGAFFERPRANTVRPYGLRFFRLCS